MKNKNKKILICGISLSIFLLIFGVTYAFFNYTGVTNESVLKAGTIYMKLSSLNEDIVLNNVFPQTREEAENSDDNYIDFEVKGKNTYDKPIYYEISTVYGSVPSGFTDDDRINDCDIMVELIDLTSGKVLVTKNYASLNNTKLYVKTIEPSNDEEKDKYRLRIWIKENTLISDSDPNKSYCASSYCNDLTKKIYSELFVSLKAKIYADLSEKTTDPTCFDYFEDTENSGEYIITGYHDDCSGTLIVPREIDGYNITQIGAGAFSGNEELTSIELLSNIKTIGTGAFSGCTNLKNVKLPNGLEVIENSAFMNCTSLKSINIPNTVTSLGAGFLYNATNMEDIYLNWTTLSDGLVYVSTFGGINKSIADIHVPTGLIETYSNNFAFTGFNIV